LNYWLFGDYIGIGAGAHGKITDLEQQRVLRRWRVRDPMRYLALAGTPGAVSGQRVLDQADRVLEFMLNACRLKRGFSKGLFESRTGIAIARVQPRLEQAFSRGLLSCSEEGRIRPTPLGHRYLNDLLALFLPEER
jgi:oxygen-independent coproporphyrinogen-3 oxidase